MATIRGIADILRRYPSVVCEVRGSTGKANTAPPALAKYANLHPVRDVAKCMEVNSALTSLNLYHNEIGVEGAKAIAEVLPKW